MAKAKFDYDSEEFYNEILALSMQGLTDAEIADALHDKFGETLTPSVFCTMKNGNYSCWNEEENRVRGERINKALARGRRKINAIVRSAYLKSALGGKRLTNKSTTTRYIETIDGERTGEKDVQTTISEIELPPNMQALSTWLNNHDEEWRKRSRGESDDIDEVTEGINIEDWIKERVK